MRKFVMIRLGVASAVVIAVAAISACGTTQSPASGSTSATPASATTSTSVAPTTTATTISEADAERLAVAAVPGSRVTEIRPDIDHGRAVWNVHLSTSNGDVEVKVDMQTGAINVGGQPSTTTRSPDDGPGHS